MLAPAFSTLIYQVLHQIMYSANSEEVNGFLFTAIPKSPHQQADDESVLENDLGQAVYP